jgi:hypothetical protein
VYKKIDFRIFSMAEMIFKANGYIRSAGGVDYCSGDAYLLQVHTPTWANEKLDI